ncbi:TRAP-type C4-dicarboxylate transport system, small permease component [Rathayibacter oskolensis]|uniref:TRAP-type C4-dicarboxylate transport system, small permease component n=1 Tax=Rathayibacter oskolensis TaxID=1891671 RepID=A0A1X7PGN1_9MICO|nr:TRAP transporter small permease [Rathayibacter oskolensis]SMH50581.1 TRAP-type C4-dicarboxylate transport system, small permease component [Rathayibacter oskolensis]
MSDTSPPDRAPEGGSAPRPPARRSIAFLDRLRRVLDRVLGVVCIVLFVALVAIVSWQVFTRQVLQNSAPWTQEAALYTFVVLALLGAALVFSERGHIAVEILVDKFPRPAQKIVAVLVQLLIVFFALFTFVAGGSRIAENAWGQAISTLPLTVGQVYLALPVAGVLITVYSLIHLARILSGEEAPTPTLDDTTEAV